MEEENREQARFWKVSSSKIDGYIRNYFIESEEGDELELDFNFSRSLVRISYRPERERGREYIAVIKNGTILQERENISRRPVDLTFRISPHLPLFRMLQEPMVLRALGGVYGIPTEPDRSARPAPFEYQVKLNLIKKFRPLERIRNHLEKKREIENRKMGWFGRFIHRLPAEAGDMTLGAILVLFYLGGYLDLTRFAGYAGALGIMMGAWDWVWRQRDPFLPKVFLMLATSGTAVYYQIQHRLWGIFL